MKEILFLALVLVTTVSADGAGHDWDYEGTYGRVKPEQWYQRYPTCGGKRQSPIDLDSDVIKADKSLKPLKFLNYDQALTGLTVQNDGHSLKVTLPKTANLQIISDSLPAPYKLTQFHFHWPSEHTVNSFNYPLELHFVHANTDLRDNETLSNPTGLVVVAVLFDYTKGTNSPGALKTLTSIIPYSTMKEGDSAVLRSPLTLSGLLPSNTRDYIRYSGSLTTPPCAEVVEFHILTSTQPIAPADAYRFATMRHVVHLSEHEEDEQLMKHNDRPIQKLNGRPLRLLGGLGDLPF